MNPVNALIIETPNVRITELGLIFEGDISFEQWAELGGSAGRLVRASLFLIGDWLVYGETRWNGGVRFESLKTEKRDRYVQAMQATGLELDTLQKAANVARSISHDQRRADLTFEHHKAVIQLKDAEARTEWLATAAEHGLSTRRLRKSINLGRIAQAHEMQTDPLDKGISNHLPWLNRLGAWWGEFESCGWFEQATPEQIETLLRDFAQVKKVIARIEAEVAASGSSIQ
jgi:hypothetical protein